MFTESAAPAATPAARPHYITHEGRQLFAWHHPARPGARRHAAVVLCPPLGSEYICVYRVWRIFAERLAGLGFDVLRFDYEGTGDSAGDPEEPGRLDAWLRNIERVVEEARRLAGSSDVALVGLRIGATLALQAAVAQGGVDRLVLWSPFRSGRAYVRELKAIAGICHKDYVMEAGGADILASGYVLPGPIARALEGLSLDTISALPARDVLIVDRDDRTPDAVVGDRLERLGCQVTRVRPPGTASMLEQVALSKVPHAAIDAITGWFAEWPSREQASAPPGDSRTNSATPAGRAGYHERAVRFGPADRLFGILSVPNGSDDAAPAVILLNTGLEYRVGPHRLYVPLARELSAQGHLVLRYDLGGIGDSAPPEGAPENVAYPSHALDDAREAIAFMRAQAPGGRLILAGLCSGAWHAFRAAREGLDVDAFVAVNPPLYLRDGLALTRRTSAYQEIGSYRNAMRDRARWVRAFRDPAAYAHFARFAADYLRRKAAGFLGASFGGRLLDGLARDLTDIGRRGITSLFVFSGGDGGFEYFQLYGRPALRGRTVRKHIRHVVVDGAGHTFSPPAAQRKLHDLLVDFVSQGRHDPATARSRSDLGNPIVAPLERAVER